MCSRSVHVKLLSAPCCGLCWEPASAVYQYYETKERYPAVEHPSTTCRLLSLSMPTSFRGHCLLYWDHHQVLLHPKMNFHSDSSRLPLLPPQLTPMFSVKVPLQNRICHVWSSVPTGCHVKEHVTRSHHN